MTSGYRKLSSKETGLVAAINELADVVGAAVRNDDLFDIADHRWLAVAETHLQQGFMALVRAVTKPKGF